MPADTFEGRDVLITGGLGMIGSTLAHWMVRHGAQVTIADSRLEPDGANVFNRAGIEERVRVLDVDIRDDAIEEHVAGQDYIFNLAGQVSHNDSLKSPRLDLDINYRGHVNVLEACIRVNPDVKILHSGSRLQYGRIEYNPVPETHPRNPATPYAVNKNAAEHDYRYCYEMHGVRTVCFRIANPFGPRSQMKHSKYSMINWFLRQAMEDKTITIYGDGRQQRDYIYVDDLVEAFVHAAASPRTDGGVYNVGSGRATRFVEMVETIVELVGSGRVEFVPWPEDYTNVETGDYWANISAIAKDADWEPKTPFREGVEKTYVYYRHHRDRYW
jgi:nucleoside-diphosphate-sugar epimerase